MLFFILHEFFLYLEVFFRLEPFGLLNFLKTILSAPDFSQNTPASALENQEDFPNAAQEKNTENSPFEERKNAPHPETSSEAQNAFTQFMSAHDARVKRIRKD